MPTYHVEMKTDVEATITVEASDEDAAEKAAYAQAMAFLVPWSAPMAIEAQVVDIVLADKSETTHASFEAEAEALGIKLHRDVPYDRG